jgi:hypothetical protein
MGDAFSPKLVVVMVAERGGQMWRCWNRASQFWFLLLLLLLEAGHLVSHVAIVARGWPSRVPCLPSVREKHASSVMHTWGCFIILPLIVVQVHWSSTSVRSWRWGFLWWYLQEWHFQWWCHLFLPNPYWFWIWFRFDRRILYLLVPPW